MTITARVDHLLEGPIYIENLTLRDLAAFTADELRSAPGVGPKAIAEIERRLKLHDLELAKVVNPDRRRAQWENAA